MNLKQKFKTLPILVIGGLIMVTTNVMAEAPKVDFPSASPSCTIKQRVGLTDIEIAYSRPGVKKRDIFGGLVPYDKVWRTGANGATKLIFSTPVKLNGHEIAAGTYALMTIPGKDEWTIIVNKGSEQWGAYKYDEKADVVRFKVKPTTMDHVAETFTIEFDDIKDESSSLNLVWDKTLVPIKVEVDYTANLEKQIEQVMASDDPKKPYFQAAMFYYNHNKDLKKANEWVDAALKERDAHYIVFLKAEILEKLGDKQGAMAAAKHSMELAEKANDHGYIKQNKDLMSRLQ